MIMAGILSKFVTKCLLLITTMMTIDWDIIVDGSILG